MLMKKLLKNKVIEKNVFIISVSPQKIEQLFFLAFEIYYHLSKYLFYNTGQAV